MADSLFEQLSNEAASGKIFDRKTIQPAIPGTGDGSPRAMQRTLEALKTVVESRDGDRAPALDRNVTLRDLIEANVLSVQVGDQIIGSTSAVGGSSVPIVTVVGTGLSGGELVSSLPYLTTMPVATGLAAFGQISSVMLVWGVIAFENFSDTEIHRATTDSLGSASLIGQSTGESFVDTTAVPGSTYYYWVRVVGVLTDMTVVTGDFNAVSGVAGGPTLVGNEDLGALIIEAGNLADNAVTSVKIDDNAITAGKLAANSIAVGTAAIQNGAIVNAMIGTAAIGTANIGSLAVTDAKIANLDGAKINAHSITALEIAANTITANEIAANTITAGKIAADTITSSEIAANAITASEIAAGAVTASKISVTQLDAVSATIGLLRTATSGARLEVSSSVIRVYDASNVLRVKIGDLS